jgi:hypothetical protein
LVRPGESISRLQEAPESAIHFAPEDRDGHGKVLSSGVLCTEDGKRSAKYASHMFGRRSIGTVNRFGSRAFGALSGNMVANRHV